jgi:hypothetical protein
MSANPIARPGPLELAFSAFQSIEHDLNLLSRRIAGVSYWPIIRPIVFDGMCRGLGLLDLPTVGSLGRVARIMAPAVTHQACAPGPIGCGCDTVVVPFPRKHLREGRRVDVITAPALADDGLGRILLLDWDADATAVPRGSVHIVRSASYHRALAALQAVPRIAPLLPEAATERRRIDAAFRAALGFGCPLSTARLAVRVAVFAQGRELARRFLRASGARRLLFAGWHAPCGLVAAARDCGLVTVEFQHGAITPLHPAYHFEGRPSVANAPDALLTFGPAWEAAAALPAETATAVMGSENIASLRRRTHRVARNVLIISQRTVGARLFADVASVAVLAPQWCFTFLAHPGEDARRYQSLRNRAPDNLRLASPGEGIYDLIRTADVQIGVYSTGLFEGMALGLRTIVMAYPGVEHIASLVAHGDVAVADDAAAVVAMLGCAPRCRDPARYYAEPVRSIAAAIAGLQLGGP